MHLANLLIAQMKPKDKRTPVIETVMIVPTD